MNFVAVMTSEQRDYLLKLAKVAIDRFNVGDWQALGVHTGESQRINNHNRLLRSLSFGDEDYDGYAYTMIFEVAEAQDGNYNKVVRYIEERYGEEGENISTSPSKGRVLTFRPSVFEIPDDQVDSTLVAVMTPFTSQFEAVFDEISTRAWLTGFRAFRAKDIWEHSTIIQDVFNLIFRAHIVVCDFTGKNPNVFYEAGIAHTLGKHVVPITQNPQDIPFDLQHHRYVHYLGNQQGISALGEELQKRFASLKGSGGGFFKSS